MNNEELLKRAERITLKAMQGQLDPIYINGIQLTGTHRDIYRGVTHFEFENGWSVPVETYGCIEQDEVIRMLIAKVEELMGTPDRMQLEAFNSPEVLEDEDPDELDPYPVFVCQCCRDDYES